MASLWLVDPAGLPKPSGKRRRIGRKPLIDLARLQAAIRDEVLNSDAVEYATRSSERQMQDLDWEPTDLFACMLCLETTDFRNAEWCEDGHGNWYACDAYAIRYDHIGRCRDRYSNINYYLKFSIEEDESLMLILIRVHL